MQNRALRLAISPCPNDTFMFDAIVNKRIDLEGYTFDVEYHDIEQLNERVLSGEAEVSKCSTALLRAVGERYRLLDSGSALGRGNGPLLVRRKGETTQIRRIAVPGLYTTANALIGRLFPDIEERVPMLFSEIAKAVEAAEFDAGVLIHEGRFVYERRNLELVADLGLEWERRVGLPLPLGSIIISKSLGEEVARDMERLIRRSIECAFAHPELSREFIKSHAQELEDEVIDKHISLFVNDFSLTLGDDGRRAVEELVK